MDFRTVFVAFLVSVGLMGCLAPAPSPVSFYVQDVPRYSGDVFIPANATGFALRASFALSEPATVPIERLRVATAAGDATADLPVYATVYVNDVPQAWSARVAGYALTSRETLTVNLPAGPHALEAPVLFYRAADRGKYPSAFTIRVQAFDTNGRLLAQGERHVQLAG